VSRGRRSKEGGAGERHLVGALCVCVGVAVYSRCLKGRCPRFERGGRGIQMGKESKAAKKRNNGRGDLIGGGRRKESPCWVDAGFRSRRVCARMYELMSFFFSRLPSPLFFRCLFFFPFLFWTGDGSALFHFFPSFFGLSSFRF